MTGLGLPEGTRPFVKDGTTPKFRPVERPGSSWLSRVLRRGELISGEPSRGHPGETFSVPGLNNDQPYTIGEKSVVILGPPFRVQPRKNIDQFNF